MLEVRDLHSFYGDAHVLHGATLRVAEGEVVALLGRNGMGKTTLISSIMRLKAPSVRQGTITWRNEELNDLRSYEVARRKIALVPQGRRLFPSLTVLEHLTMHKPAVDTNGWTVERIFEIFPRLAERRNHRGGPTRRRAHDCAARLRRRTVLGPPPSGPWRQCRHDSAAPS